MKFIAFRNRELDKGSGEDIAAALDHAKFDHLCTDLVVAEFTDGEELRAMDPPGLRWTQGWILVSHDRGFSVREQA